MTAELIFGDVPPLEVAFTDKRGDQEKICATFIALAAAAKRD